jgi:hypothetical protein
MQQTVRGASDVSVNIEASCRAGGSTIRVSQVEVNSEFWGVSITQASVLRDGSETRGLSERAGEPVSQEG